MAALRLGRSAPWQVLTGAIRLSATASSSSTSPSEAATTWKFSGEIPTDEIEKKFTLSSGPGGQNVQKNATKCEIRFNVKKASWLSNELKEALLRRYPQRITKTGELVIDSDRTRERHLNLADCFDKLRSTVYETERSLHERETTEEDAKIIHEKAAKAAAKRLAEKRRRQDERRLDVKF